MPVYDEGDNIRQSVSAIVTKVKYNFSLFLIYDFAEDDTLPAAKEVAKELGIGIQFLKNKYGKGVLNAIRTGFEETNSEYVVVTMADLSDPAEVINHMYAKAVEVKADVVCASRYMPGGRQIGGPLIKKMLSRFAGVSLHYLIQLPTRDVTNNFKLYSRRLLSAISIESQGGFELGMEIVLKAHFLRFKVAEVPTVWQDRTQGKSRFRLFTWLPRYLNWYFFALMNFLLIRPKE